VITTSKPPKNWLVKIKNGAILAEMNWLESILPFIQIILSILLVAAILLQRSEAGLGSAFGGGDGGGPSTHTKRGFEKTLFQATIILAILFALSAFIALVIN